MAKTFIMRAYDPAGQEYVYWEADEYDGAGGSYPGAGYPPFPSLEDVACLLVVSQTRSDLFIMAFESTQDRDETTPDHEGTSFESVLKQFVPEYDPLNTPILYTTQDRDETTPDHEGTSFESTPKDFPPEFDVTAVPPYVPTTDRDVPTEDCPSTSFDSTFKAFPPESDPLNEPIVYGTADVPLNEFYFPGGEGQIPAVPQPLVATASMAPITIGVTKVATPEPLVATTEMAEIAVISSPAPLVVTTSMAELDPPITRPVDGIEQLQVVTSVAEFAATFDPLVYPNEITGLIGWWDASDESTLTSDDDDPVAGNQDRVKIMADKSGLGNDFVSPASPYVRWAKDISGLGIWPINKGYLQFTSKDFPKPYMRINPVTVDWDTKFLTVFGIVSPGYDGDWIHYLSQRANEEGSRNLGHTFGAFDVMRLHEPSGEDAISRSYGATAHWMCARYQLLIGLFGDPDIIRVKIYNSTGSYTSDFDDTISGPSDIVTLGTGIEYPSYVLDRYWDNGLFAEAMVWDRALSDSEVAEMARYASHFWDVTE